MAHSTWATQQLAEFLSVLTTGTDDVEAVSLALERLAESFDADAGAFFQGGGVVSSLGWAAGSTPTEELAAAAAGDRSIVGLPGIGPCHVVVIPVDRRQETSLLLARSGYAFTVEDVGLLRGMARVLALGLQLLGTVAAERGQADQNRELVATLRARQALLERLSRIQRQIASRAPLRQILDAVAAGASELLGGDLVAIELSGEGEPVGEGELSGEDEPAGESEPAGDDGPGPAASEAALAVPLQRDGRSVGALVVRSSGRRTFSDGERELVVAFADHASLALNDARTHEAMQDALRAATYQATHDALTGLPNRACLYERGEDALRRAAGDGSATAILLFDLNHFKEINDTLGHKYGDRVLREIGPRFRRVLSPADTLARLGGDEFCVLLPALDGHDGLGAALDVARSLVATLEEPCDIDGLTMDVQASCGIAIAPKDGDTVDVLLQHADVAMYVAKDSQAKVITYEDELDTNTPARLALLGELRSAISRDQFVLHYQPKASFGRLGVEGVEALVRWRHPTRGLVAPDEFIPLAEHAGLIKPLTSWVLDEALGQLRRWRDDPSHPVPADFSIAVNLSARSFFDDTLLTDVTSALDRWEIPAHLLELEITESMIMVEPARARRLFAELSKLGVKLAIDDFGAGYSSLTYLKNLPVDQLKIDRSFVLQMQEDPNAAIIVRAVTELGHNLGLHVVAEGIEDHATWEQLAELGCDSGQGYLLARPMPAERLAEWLQRPSERPVICA